MIGDKLSQIISQQQKPTNNFVFGVVISLSPLTISIKDFPNISGEQIILSSNLKDKGMSIGDKLFIIKSNDSQKYYLCEVVE